MRILMLAGACLAVLSTAACDKATKTEAGPKTEAATTAPAEAPTLTPASSTEAAPDKAGATTATTTTTTTSKSAAPQTRTAAYTPVPISREDSPGRARQIRCQVGTDPETNCTFTPLFGDGSFQLDGPEIALRMVISDSEGSLFEVFGPDRRVSIGGTYRRDPRDGACWITNEETPAPSRVCAR